MGAGAATVVALTKRQSKAESWTSSLYLPECRALKSDTPSTLKDDGLAVYHELLVAILQGRLDNPWIPTGPVVAALGDQADAVAVALQPQQPVAVVFDLVQPVRGVGDGGGSGRKAKVEGAGHGAKIGN
jgi:hypothetical protein